VRVQCSPCHIEQKEPGSKLFGLQFLDVSVGNALRRQGQEGANTTEKVSYLMPQPSFS
jgi:hypothetical protein